MQSPLQEAEGTKGTYDAYHKSLKWFERGRIAVIVYIYLKNLALSRVKATRCHESTVWR